MKPGAATAVSRGKEAHAQSYETRQHHRTSVGIRRSSSRLAGVCHTQPHSLIRNQSRRAVHHTDRHLSHIQPRRYQQRLEIQCRWGCREMQSSQDRRVHRRNTHTQVTITSVTFGDGSRGNCDATSGGFSGVVRNGGTSTGQLDSIDGGATTTRPWFFHVRRFTAVDVTSSGTININRFQFTFTIIGVACQITITPQSVNATYTNTTRVVNISDLSVSYTESTGGVLCPLSRGTGGSFQRYLYVGGFPRVTATS